MINLKSYNRWTGSQKLIIEYKLKHGIEIGTRECFFSDWILTETPIEILYGLDIVKHPHADSVIKRHPERFKFILGKSPDYTEMVPDDYFDFIYIDAAHDYDSVKADVWEWWPLLKDGGILMGDDYMTPKATPEGDYGIVRAVNEFVQKNDLKLYITGLDVGPNNFEEFIKWADFNTAEAIKNNTTGKSSFVQNVQWVIQKEL